MTGALQPTITGLLESIIEGAFAEAPLLSGGQRADDPLHAALVPDVVMRAARFERRFNAALGGVWQELAVVAAAGGLGFAAPDHPIRGVVKEGRLRRIAEVLNRLEHPRRDESRVWPNWDEELRYIKRGRGNDIPVTVNCAMYAEDSAAGHTYAIELQAPLPKSDQAKASKEKLLKLYCMEPSQVTGAYFALPYAPYGKRAADAWSDLGRWFDTERDGVVLIGDRFWDTIGGLATYRAFIAAVSEIGAEHKERIYREYLGIEPPRPPTEGNL